MHPLFHKSNIHFSWIRVTSTTKLRRRQVYSAAIVAIAFSCGRKPTVNATNDTPSHDSGGRTLDEAWRRSKLRPPLSWLQAAECDVTVGFRPQLHAAAAIAAQTELAYPHSTNKRLRIEIKTNNWTVVFVRFVTQGYSINTFASDRPQSPLLLNSAFA